MEKILKALEGSSKYAMIVDNAMHGLVQSLIRCARPVNEFDLSEYSGVVILGIRSTNVNVNEKHNVYICPLLPTNIQYIFIDSNSEIYKLTKEEK